MRTLAFDGRVGASGDMILGALLAAGAGRGALAPVEDRLGVRYDVREVTEGGVAATDVDVLLEGEGAEGRGREGSNGHDRGHDGDGEHDHDGEHGHHHDQDGDGEHGHHHDQDGDGDVRAEGHGPTRSYEEVVAVVESLSLPAGVEADALGVIDLLGESEAAVHGGRKEGTVFHAVGAALLLEDLGVDRVVTTPLATGGGEADTGHGRYPVPVPAVVEIAERSDYSLRGGPVDRELLTPTGAAVLGHFAEGVDSLPALRVEGAGYGAGGYDLGDRPNVLRAVVGGSESLQREEITVLETNLDDAAPELLGGLQETLSEAGALDVTVLPATMKKSRPGHLVKVVVAPEDAERVARALAVETGTLGVREHGAGHRWTARRSVETVTVRAGGGDHEVGVKLARDAEGRLYDVSAEFDDALGVARETDLPVREVMRRAEEAARE